MYFICLIFFWFVFKKNYYDVWIIKDYEKVISVYSFVLYLWIIYWYEYNKDKDIKVKILLDIIKLLLYLDNYFCVFDLNNLYLILVYINSFVMCVC